MVNKIRSFVKEERGNAIVLTSLMLIILLGITGLVIDGGILYVTKTHLQKTANAATLSGAQELFNEEQTVTTIVEEILNAHNEKNSLNGTGHREPVTRNWSDGGNRVLAAAGLIARQRGEVYTSRSPLRGVDQRHWRRPARRPTWPGGALD